MLNILKSAEGILEMELTGADYGRTFRELGEAGIPLYHVEIAGPLTVRFQISRHQLKTARRICKKRGDDLKILRERGSFYAGRRLFSRPVLLLGLMFITAFFLFLPSRIFFIRVQGNGRIPSARILEAAEDCGVRFGAARKSLRNEAVKNELLSKIPELAWAGLEVRGCAASISVREHDFLPEQPKIPGVSSMVAVRDAVIDSCTAMNGNMIVKPGQAVLKGQMLISGYTDCGSTIRVSQAEGEVYGKTVREIRAFTPDDETVRIHPHRKSRVYSVLAGKKRIKIWGSSRNWHTSCGRMYEEYYITLPGGYVLPLALCVDEYTEYDTVLQKREPQQVQKCLSEFGKQSVLRQMIGGSVLEAREQQSHGEGVFLLEGRYLCREMIGRIRQEKYEE